MNYDKPHARNTAPTLSMDSHPAESMKGLLTRRIFLVAGDKMEVDVFNPPREDSVQGNDAYLRR